ncbi:hypothetical protein [Streptomyces noursei]|uniref:hypothetical protein n=1 Tax=Streptomyces noursei TaxID=1971 RepID=UPI0019632B4F|nr:hypothetical protein [Streptomyces noursei]QRX89932.1 hypothetical protein JNO44_02810 [Streptomyces noursei]
MDGYDDPPPPESKTLWFGRDPDTGAPITLKVQDLGNGIGIVDWNIAGVLHHLRMGGDDREWRKYLNRKFTEPTAGGSRSWAEKNGFEAYTRRLLDMLVKDRYGGNLSQGKRLVESIGKLVPIPGQYDRRSPEAFEPVGFRDFYTRDERTNRNKQILELLPEEGQKYGEDSGIRVLIANGGTEALSAAVVAGDERLAGNAHGTWAIVSLPHGVTVQTEGRIVRPDIMLGSLLRTAASLQSGNYLDTPVELPIKSEVRKTTSYETAVSDVSSFEVLGNETALRYYQGRNRALLFDEPVGPLPLTRSSCEFAETFAEQMKTVTEQQKEADPGLRALVEAVENLSTIRGEASAINERTLCKERELTPRSSPSTSAGLSWVYQLRLLTDPWEITRDMTENPNTTKFRKDVFDDQKFLWKPTSLPLLGGVLGAESFLVDATVTMCTVGLAPPVLADLLKWSNLANKGIRALRWMGNKISAPPKKETWGKTFREQYRLHRRNPGIATELAVDAGSWFTEKFLLPKAVKLAARLGHNADAFRVLVEQTPDDDTFLARKANYLRKRGQDWKGFWDQVRGPEGVSKPTLYRAEGISDLSGLRIADPWKSPLPNSDYSTEGSLLSTEGDLLGAFGGGIDGFDVPRTRGTRVAAFSGMERVESRDPRGARAFEAPW